MIEMWLLLFFIAPGEPVQYGGTYPTEPQCQAAPSALDTEGKIGGERWCIPTTVAIA